MDFSLTPVTPVTPISPDTLYPYGDQTLYDAPFLFFNNAVLIVFKIVCYFENHIYIYSVL